MNSYPICVAVYARYSSHDQDGGEVTDLVVADIEHREYGEAGGGAVVGHGL